MATQNKKKTKKKIASSSTFSSKIEKDLVREVAGINKRARAEEEFEETKRQTMMNFTLVKPETVPPTAHKVIENKEKFGRDTEDKITEWEKNTIKRLFKVYDKDKSGFLDITELQKLMKDLINDKGIMGKIPRITEAEVEHLFDSWDKNKDNKISWQEFRNGLNNWEWRLMDKEEMHQRIDQYFEEANRKKVQGNMKEAYELSCKALALQG